MTANQHQDMFSKGSSCLLKSAVLNTAMTTPGSKYDTPSWLNERLVYKSNESGAVTESQKQSTRPRLSHSFLLSQRVILPCSRRIITPKPLQMPSRM
jgi:hypothetical protein